MSAVSYHSMLGGQGASRPEAEAHSWQVELTTVPYMLGLTPRKADHYPFRELHDATTALTLVLTL